MDYDRYNFHESRENQEASDGSKSAQKNEESDICKDVSKTGESSKSSSCGCKSKSKSRSRSRRRRRRRSTRPVANPYILFYLKMFYECWKKNQPVTEIAKIAGKRWCQMTDKQKEKYIQQAKAMREKRDRVKRRGKC